MEEKQQFKDKSGDKKHFTIVPNMIVNGYSAVESGIYLYIKKVAGENGPFFRPASKVASELKISKPFYLKVLKKLIKDGRLKFIGWKEGKTHPVKIYEVVDIWGENLGRYKKKGKLKNASLGKKGKLKNFSKVNNVTTTKNPLEEKPLNKEPIIIDKNNLRRLNGLKAGFVKKTSMPVL